MALIAQVRPSGREAALAIAPEASFQLVESASAFVPGRLVASCSLAETSLVFVTERFALAGPRRTKPNRPQGALGRDLAAALVGSWNKIGSGGD